MRVLFVIFICAFSIAAQTAFVKQTYEAGNAAARQLQYEQAVKAYRTTLLRAHSESLSDELLAKIHFNIGVCLYHLKQTNEAVAEYTEAIKLSRREYRKAFHALAMAQKDLRNWRAAANALRDALEIEKADGEAWFDLALIYLETRDFEAAEKAFVNAVRYKSVSAADAHNNLGVIAALRSDWAAAEKHFETALLDSSGTSIEAVNNLRFCKFYKQNIRQKDWLAKLEFSGTNKGE